MKELSTHFCIIRPELIRANLSMKENIGKPAKSPEFYCTQKILLEQEPSTDEAGTKWTITFRAVTKDSSARNADGSKQYIGVYQTDGSLHIIGSATDAPLISVSPAEGGVYVVSASFEDVSPVEL